MKLTMFLTILYFAYSAWSANEYQVSLESNKQTYIIYEPVYLTMTAESGTLRSGGLFGPLGDHTADVLLRVQTPNGSWIDYSSPVQMERLRTPDMDAELVVDECVVLSRNTIVTAAPGTYHFALYSKSAPALAVSNVIEVAVNEPTTEVDKADAAVIAQNPLEYAFFVYLNGGDHLKDGLRINSKLAESNSVYSHVAKAVTSINSSQISFDFENGKVRRDRDFAKAEKYFPDAFDLKVPVALRLEAACAIKRQMEEAKIRPKSLEDKVAAVRSSLMDTKHNRSWKFKALSE